MCVNGLKSFKTVLMNPPYSLKWGADKELLKDERFKAFGVLAPKSKADYSFVLHGFSKLDDKGTMAVVLPHGILLEELQKVRFVKSYLRLVQLMELLDYQGIYSTTQTSLP